ncbi:MAG: type II toxin-antitoxin system VapC family toxin [Myxococcota bacterium]|nr:type II toxin-antitoxin system VapC family toxin [Myxococcota bacterium]
MKYLLDTHAFLWWAFDAPELSATARGLIADRGNQVLFSSASAWEISTKFRIGRLPEAAPLMQDLAGWIQKAGFSELAIQVQHAQRAGGFPQEHKDPFDRMIAAQSLVENVPVIGKDDVLRGFGATLHW